MGSVLFKLGYRQLKGALLLKKDGGLLLTGWFSDFYEAAFWITQ